MFALLQFQSVDGIGIGIAEVERQSHTVLNRVLAPYIYQIDAFGVVDLDGEVRTDLPAVGVDDEHGLDIVVVLVVEQEGDEGSPEGVALADQTEFHLHLLVAFYEFV
jgi:hypothetical protein